MPWGGGEGACHSRVVASQGLSLTLAPCRMLMKKLMMNGICDSASPHAHHDYMRFSGPTAPAKSYVAPPSARMFCPTMKPACVEQRKAQAAPNSAAVP